MIKDCDFKLTPAYCLYNGAAVLEQDGAYIKFLVENKKDALLCGRLSRAFENHVANIRRYKNCPESYQRLISINFESGTRAQLKKTVLKLYKADNEGLGNNTVAEKGPSQNEEAAAVLLLDSILNEARQRQATDIHIEDCSVRLRVNGQLEKILDLQKDKANELIQRIKILSGMNVIENRRCQDGSFIYGNKEPFFLRVSTMSAMGKKFEGGESLVMRLLDTARIPLSLGELGFNSCQLEKLAGKNGLCSLANGLVLVCGSTGSGKSTTVASMLLEIEKQSGASLKIISLEDPPEYIIPGITQVKIDEQHGFSDALNHLFRQDPDVIMIGEIRDEESAASAFRASLTGHLVFATLHCGSAAESIIRLENLGVEKNSLCQILRGVICQELNYNGERMRLYADLAIPGEAFYKKALKTSDYEELENLMEHYTNYSEILGETIASLKRGKPVPLYSRRQKNAGIHKNVI